MVVYNPITEKDKQQWIEFLLLQISILDGRPEDPKNSEIFKTPEGDIATAKDLVGNLLALLTEKPITIT